MAGTRPSCVATIGSGPADNTPWIGRGAMLYAFDTDASFRPTSPHPSLRFAVSNATHLPLASGSMDVTCAFDVIEHVDDDAGVLREMERVTRPGGLLVVTVPALPSLWGPHDVVNQHKRRYTRRTLRASFARAGIHGARITYFNALLFPAVAAIRWSRRLLGREEKATDLALEHLPRPSVNALLRAVFSLERHLVLRVPLPVGVSLLAVVRRAG